MPTQARTLKGFRDFLPEEALKREWLKEIISNVFKRWGYDPLETPTLEPLELFEGEIGEDEKLFFKFEDPGGRQVALRYDQTVPACRVVGQYNQELPMPFKRYQIQPAFRAEKPQRGRYREFLQCDADIFGIASPIADAETIALSLDIYRQIGFKQAKVLISDRCLLQDMPYAAIVEIDKIKKIGLNKVIKNMEAKGITHSQAVSYIEQIEKLQPNPTIQTILDYLEAMGFNSDWYAFEPTIARSFSYSTGPIWEVEIPGFTGGSVLGGERYDQLVNNFSGINIPGTGFGLGFDRTLEAAEQFGLIPSACTVTRILITVFDSDSLNHSLKLASTLRNAGINTEVYPDVDVNMKKQLAYADKKGIPFVIILGPDEVKQNLATIKEMKSGAQTSISRMSLIQYLLSLLERL
jgi:histidyl-tRNA synthetase